MKFTRKQIKDARYDVWRHRIYAEHNYRCAVCGCSAMEAHHPFGRAGAMMFDIGINLCPGHHKFDNNLSAHSAKGSLNWRPWLENFLGAELYEEKWKLSNAKFKETLNESIVKLFKETKYLSELDHEMYERAIKVTKRKNVFRFFDLLNF